MNIATTLKAAMWASVVLRRTCRGFNTAPSRELTSLLRPPQHPRTSTSLPQLSTSASRRRCRRYGDIAATSAVRATSSSSLSSSSSTVLYETKDDVVELRLTDFTSGGDGKKEEGEAVILLHGLLGSKRNFATLGTALAGQLRKKRRVVAVDLRNHGENNHDWREDMSYTEMARDVLAMMDREGLQNAVLVGHSMGGKVAKALALLHPDRVAGLVVLDIAPVRYSPEEDSAWRAVKEIVDALVQLRLLPGMTKRDVDVELRPLVEDPALRAFVLTNLDQPRKKRDKDGEQEEQMLRWKINMDAIGSQLDTLAGFDIAPEEVVGKEEGGRDLTYEGDTFFIHGGQSRFVRHSYMEKIATFFPNHMLTTIRGAGHWVHAEAPDDTLALLKRYLDR